MAKAAPVVPSQTQRRYADQASASGEGSGVVKKSDKNAKPKILEPVPSAEETNDVKKHNEDFEDRPDRATNYIDDKGRPKVGKMAQECEAS